MLNCAQCGGTLRRVHRTFLERFNYMAIYECQKCDREEFMPRRFRYHFGAACRCPICGTYRVVRLKERDHIDRLHGGFLNLLERLVGGNRLYHCRWCRAQFYDHRKTAVELPTWHLPEARPEVGRHSRPDSARLPETQNTEPAK